MKLSSSYTNHALLLLSLAYASCCIADNLSSATPLTSESVIPQEPQDDASARSPEQEVTEPKKPELSLADHLRHALAAGLIKTCQAHHVKDELNAHIHSPEDGSTFSSTVSNNGDGILDRMARIAGTQPTISISSTAVFTPEETEPKIRFKRAMLKFAEDKDLPCTQTTDSNGNKEIICTIEMELREFLAWEAQYENSHS